MTSQSATPPPPTNHPWFDDNSQAWQGPKELGFADDISLWNYVDILGTRFLGDVHGKVSLKVDLKDRTGKNGGTPTANGLKNSQIQVTLYLPTAVDLEAYAKIAATSLSPSSNQGQAMRVTHPALALHGIDELYFYSADLIKPPQSGKPASVNLHFHQFSPEQPGKNRSSTPTHATAGAPGKSNTEVQPKPPANVGPSTVARPPLPQVPNV